MRKTAGIFVVSCCVLAGTVAMTGQAQGPAAGAPQGQGPGGAPGGGGARGPQNLKVLPSTWTNQQVGALMQTFVQSLGVTGPEGPGCGFCHTPNASGRGFNTAADDKKEKEVARQMIKMTMAINSDYLKDVGVEAADAAVPEKVSCFTCHNGQKKPGAVPASGWTRGGFSLLPAGPPTTPPGGGPGGGGPGGGGAPGANTPPAGGR
jgi:hypothetical protein